MKEREEHQQCTYRRYRARPTAVASMVLAAAIGICASALAVAQEAGKAEANAAVLSQKNQPVIPFGGYGGGAAIPEPQVPIGVDVFDLTLQETRLYSRSKGFEVVGHSYFKGPWLTPFARDHGLGAGFNVGRVYNGIGYFAGYNGPPTLFGTIIADVRNSRDMKALSFVPCMPGTRCPYVRVNTDKMIMVGTHDTN